MKKYTKGEAIKIVTSCARAYAAELLNRSLLFVCQDKHKRVSCIEFCFYDRNFLHLTGLKLRKREKETANGENLQSAGDFFANCLAHRVSPEDFDFAPDGTTALKLEVLPLLITKNLSANIVGNFSSLRPKLYTQKLAGGNKGCMGFCIDAISGSYVPNTVLNEDIRDNVDEWARVIAVYRKDITQEKYTEITYLAKKIDWTSISFPEQYSDLPKPVQAVSI